MWQRKKKEKEPAFACNERTHLPWVDKPEEKVFKEEKVYAVLNPGSFLQVYSF